MIFRILIADDHEVVRRGIRTLIEELKEWSVCGEAATGGEAVEKAGALHPDMLLLDVTLPDMDSAEVVSRIMATCPAVKIVAMAMPASGVQAAKAVGAGASGVAMKSDAAKDILATLQNIGTSHPFSSPAAVALLQSQLATNRTPETMPGDLTPRESEVLKLLAKGLTNRGVAASLAISVKTVDVHRAHVMRKLQLATYCDLILFAIRHKIIEI